jgi:cytochrome c oxidase subunit 2
MKSTNSNFLHYLFELAWILPSVAIPMMLLVAIILTAFAVGIGVPGIGGRVDPLAVAQRRVEPFNEPGVRELAPGRYEVVMIAQTFAFEPREIRVPQGSRVTFKVTSPDVIHGLKIENTPLNVMVVPGQISEVTVDFDRPGEYLFVCHEYCGGAHHIMEGTVIVE